MNNQLKRRFVWSNDTGPIMLVFDKEPEKDRKKSIKGNANSGFYGHATPTDTPKGGGSVPYDTAPISMMTDDELPRLLIAKDVIVEDIEKDTRAGNKLHVMDQLYQVLKNNEDWNEHVISEYEPEDEIHHGMCSEGEVRDLIAQWAATSSDSAHKSIALQMCAQELFDLPEGTLQSIFDNCSPGALYSAKQQFRDCSIAYKTFLKTQYDLTQKYFKDHGVEEILCFRGVCSGKGEGLDRAIPYKGFSDVSVVT